MKIYTKFHKILRNVSKFYKILLKLFEQLKWREKNLGTNRFYYRVMLSRICNTLICWIVAHSIWCDHLVNMAERTHIKHYKRKYERLNVQMNLRNARCISNHEECKIMMSQNEFGQIKAHDLMTNKLGKLYLRLYH